MSFRSRLILLGSLCGVLLSTLLLGQVFSPGRSAGAGVRLFPDLKTEAVRKISLKAGSGQIVLARQNDWVLQAAGREFPASGQRAGNLLTELASLSRGSVITSRQDAWAGLGLEGAEAKVLSVFGGKGEKLAELTIGKTGVGGGGSYIRVGEEKQVYQTGASLGAYLDPERRFWSNLKLLPDGLKAANVARISIQGRIALEDGKKTRSLGYSLVRTPDGKGRMRWIIEGQKDLVLDEPKVEQIVSNLIGCEGNDFADNTEATRKAMAGAQAEVTLSMGDNRDFTLVVGGKAEGSQFHAGIKGSELVYLVPEWRLDRILAERESLNSPTR